MTNFDQSVTPPHLQKFRDVMGISSDLIGADEEVIERRRDVPRQWKNIYPEDASAELDRREIEKRAVGVDGTVILF